MDPQIGIPEVTDISTLGLGGFFVWHVSRLFSKVADFLEQTAQHQKKVRNLLRELVIATRRGAPAEEIEDPTPPPRAVEAIRR